MHEATLAAVARKSSAGHHSMNSQTNLQALSPSLSLYLVHAMGRTDDNIDRGSLFEMGIGPYL